MVNVNLKGKKISMVIESPREVIIKCRGKGPFEGVIVDIDSNKLLAVLHNPIKMQDELYLTIDCILPEGDNTMITNMQKGSEVSTSVFLMKNKIMGFGDVKPEEFYKGIITGLVKII